MKKVYAVGIGPGDTELMTLQARNAIAASDVVCGYNVYVDLVKELCEGKETFTTPMMKEIERCRWAIERAYEGHVVSMVCSGDSGVYGMASLLIELSEAYLDVEIEVVPGTTAALSGGAVLGAPLSHDFCVISLSDLLTPWNEIEKRLECAAMGDFAIAIYNPRSKKRADYLNKACNILMRHKSPDTVCGWVRNIGRDGQEYKLMTLAELADEEVDMFTTVFVGASETRETMNRMVTPRGYSRKK